MQVETFVLGGFQTNAFVVHKGTSSPACVVIDAGLSAQPMIAYLQRSGLRPEAVLLTHGHADHIEGVRLLREHFPDVEVVIHKADAVLLGDPMANVSAMVGMPLTIEPAEVVLEAEGAITYAGLTFHVLHTPGHTPGGVCFYCSDQNVVFVGDTLFAGSIGRTDFPGGNTQQLLESIHRKLFTLPDETIVYNGHGPKTTIGQEKRHNPFLRKA